MSRLSRLPLHGVLVGIALLWSLPTVALFISSFRDARDIAASGWWNALVPPFGLTLENYATVLAQRGMAQAFLNTILISVPSTVLVLAVASLAAYAFAWMAFPGRRTLFVLTVALMVVPLQMTLIPVLRLFSQAILDVPLPVLGGRLFGTGSFPAIWLAHTAYGLPFAVFLLRGFFAALPVDLVESAQLDGASDGQVFRRIVLPLSRPALAALAIFQFLWTWNDLLVALVLLKDPNLAPMTLRISNLVSSFGSQYQLLTAAAFLSVVVPLVVFFALQRHFVRGILAGAIKG